MTDREILKAQKDLAELEGILADPASATTLAGLIKLSMDRKLLRGEVVLIITGSGLKTMEALKKHTVHPKLLKPKIADRKSRFAKVLYV